ncbi:MAG: hypothetical protein ACLFTB_03655 [Desulfovibrionales bacterium]
MPAQARSLDNGAKDNVLQDNVSDQAGRSPGFHETFVRVVPSVEEKVGSNIYQEDI